MMMSITQGVRLFAAALVLSFPALAGPATAQDPNDDRQRPMMERQAVDWAAVREALRERRLLRTPRIERMNTADLDACRIPILLPVRERMMQSIRVFPHRDSYAAFIDRGTHTIEIVGTRLQRPAGSSPRQSRMMRNAMRGDAQQYVLSRTDFGVDVSFSRYRVAYTISIVCDSGVRDPICGEDEYILSLLESLAFAGGRPDTENDPEPLPQGQFVEPEDAP